MAVPLLRLCLLPLMIIGASAELIEDYSKWDPAYDNSLFRWNDSDIPDLTLTTSSGAVVTLEDTVSLNKNLLLNGYFVDMMTHITRERINERVAHAKGTGGFGVFKVLHDFSHISKAKFFKLGTETPVALRVSMTTGERGLPDLRRNFRGFAVKFRTEEGNFDIVGFNTPMYFYRDPIKFVAFSHGARRNPATNLYDTNAMWDLITNNPECLPCFLLTFAGYGYPASYRKMSGFGIHTYQFQNANGVLYFGRFIFKPKAGVENLSWETIQNNSASKLDHLHADMYRSISIGDYPSWKVYLQLLTEEQARENEDEVFDVTKYLDEDKYPLQEFGEMIINRNPINNFAEIEQLALMPGNVVPGIAGAPDKLYEARVYVYRDAQMYRLGPNVNNIAVNCPFQVQTNTFNRDGLPPVKHNEYDAPTYADSSFNGAAPSRTVSMKDLITIKENPANNTQQATNLYTNMLTDAEREFLVKSLTASLNDVHSVRLQARAIEALTNVHSDLGRKVAQGLEC